jgi:hypothetical protein
MMQAELMKGKKLRGGRKELSQDEIEEDGKLVPLCSRSLVDDMIGEERREMRGDMLCSSRIPSLKRITPLIPKTRNNRWIQMDPIGCPLDLHIENNIFCYKIIDLLCRRQLLSSSS